MIFSLESLAWDFVGSLPGNHVEKDTGGIGLGMQLVTAVKILSKNPSGQVQLDNVKKK